MKRLLLILMAVLTGVAAQAQGRRDSAINSTLNLIGTRRPVRSNLQLWVVGHGGLSRVTSNYDKSVELKDHDIYGGGILVEAGRFAMTGQTGLLYFQEGMNATTKTTSPTGSTGTASFIGELSYIGVPAVGRWNAVRRGRSRLSFGLGLMPAVFVNAKFKIHGDMVDSSGAAYSFDTDSSDTSGIRKVNVMALASIGGDIGLNRNQDMRLEVAYRRGLMPMTESSDSGAYTNSVIMNLGFGFDI